MKSNSLIITIFGILFILNSILVSAQTNDYYNCPMGGMMYGLYGNYGLGFASLSWITFILFIVLVSACIYWLIKSANKKR